MTDTPDDNDTDAIGEPEENIAAEGPTAADAVETAEKSEATDEAKAVQTSKTPQSKRSRSGVSGAKPTGKKATAKDTAKDGAKPTAQAKEPEAGPKPKRGKEISFTLSARTVLAVVGVIVIAAAAVGVGVLGWSAYRDRQQLNAFDDIKESSESFAVALVTAMNSENVATMRETLIPMTTSPFRDQLSEEQEQGTQAIADLNVQATPEIRAVGVESYDRDTARTSVFMSVTGTSTVAPEGGQELMLIWFDLKREDGKWLISAVDDGRADERAGQNQQAPGAPASDAPAGESPAPAPEGEQPPTEEPAPEPAP